MRQVPGVFACPDPPVIEATTPSPSARQQRHRVDHAANPQTNSLTGVSIESDGIIGIFSDAQHEIEARKGGQLSITSIPKAPTGLTAPGRALWRSVLTHYWMDGESHKLAILEQA